MADDKFKLNIKAILKDLSMHHRSREQLLAILISNRLEKSIQTYYKHINDCYEQLSYCNSLKLAKRLNKYDI